MLVWKQGAPFFPRQTSNTTVKGIHPVVFWFKVLLAQLGQGQRKQLFIVKMARSGSQLLSAALLALLAICAWVPAFISSKAQVPTAVAAAAAAAAVPLPALAGEPPSVGIHWYWDLGIGTLHGETASIVMLVVFLTVIFALLGAGGSTRKAWIWAVRQWPLFHMICEGLCVPKDCSCIRSQQSVSRCFKIMVELGQDFQRKCYFRSFVLLRNRMQHSCKSQTRVFDIWNLQPQPKHSCQLLLATEAFGMSVLTVVSTSQGGWFDSNSILVYF